MGYTSISDLSLWSAAEGMGAATWTPGMIAYARKKSAENWKYAREGNPRHVGAVEPISQIERRYLAKNPVPWRTWLRSQIKGLRSAEVARIEALHKARQYDYILANNDSAYRAWVAKEKRIPRSPVPTESS